MPFTCFGGVIGPAPATECQCSHGPTLGKWLPLPAGVARRLPGCATTPSDILPDTLPPLAAGVVPTAYTPPPSLAPPASCAAIVLGRALA